MKLSGYLEAFYDASEKLSEINRQIAFAGIALIWIFKEGQAPDFKIQTELILPAIFFVGALALDITQYAYKTLFWHFFHRHHEKKVEVGEDPEILAPPNANVPTWILFGLKVALVVVSYVMIFFYLKGELSPN
jgi:hypothetical protein